MSWSDDYIHHWGEVFTANRIYRRFRVRFDTFLEAPEAILEATVLRAPLPPEQEPGCRELLPAQARVQALLDAEALAAPGLGSRSGGAGTGAAAAPDMVEPGAAADSRTGPAANRVAAEELEEMIEQELASMCRLANGAWLEPLRHHRHFPRRKARGFHPLRAAQ